MPGPVIPSLEQFTAGTPGARYGGPPDPTKLPARYGITASAVGRGVTAQPTVLEVVNEDGLAIPVDLSRLTADQVNAAADAPASAYGDRQTAAAAIYHGLAVEQARSSAPPRGRPKTAHVETLAPPGRAFRPAAVGRPEPPPAGDPDAHPVVGGYVEQGYRPVVAAPQQSAHPLVPPPAQKVTFEVPGFGFLDVYFHQVIRTQNHLVLVRDTRSPGPTGFPQQAGAQVGVRVADSDRLLAAVPAGIEFTVGFLAMCVMEVRQERAAASYQADDDPLAAAMAAAMGGGRGENRGHPGGGHPAAGLDFGHGHDDTPGV